MKLVISLFLALHLFLTCDSCMSNPSANLVRAAGGQDGGIYSPHKEDRWLRNSKPNPEGGRWGIPVWVVFVLIPVILVGGLICLICCVRRIQKQRKVTSRICYLCLERVEFIDWDHGIHRKQCMYGRQYEVFSFPEPHNVHCPNCNDKLRLWPEKGDPFSCSQCKKEDIRNDGSNRLVCFLCDYSICISCVGNRMREELNEVKVTKPILKDNTLDDLGGVEVQEPLIKPYKAN